MKHNIPTWDSNDYQLVLSSEALQPEGDGDISHEGFGAPHSGVVTLPRTGPHLVVSGAGCCVGGLLHAGESSVFQPSPRSLHSNDVKKSLRM